MAKSTYDFPADASFEAAARDVLHSGMRKMLDNQKGTRAGLDKSVATPDEIEALHDMRVGSRRVRAGLSVFGGLFSQREFESLDGEVGRITDALGAVRDLDVQLDTLRALQSALPANEAYGIGRLIERQTKRRDKERVALAKALDRMSKDHFGRQFKKLLDKVAPKAAPKADDKDGNAQDGAKLRGEAA